MSLDRAPVTRTDPVTGQPLRIQFEEIEALSHADAEALLAYWSHCRKSGGFVMSRDVPSKAIARLMKYLVVLEPLTDCVDFKYHLTGMVLTERLGRDVTGMLISEVFEPGPAQSLIDAARKTIDTDGPIFARIHIRGVLSDVRKPELVLLPIGQLHAPDTWVLVGVFYHPL